MDVLLSVNNIQIAHNGTVHIRGRERVSLEYIVSQISPSKNRVKVDESFELEVFRNGETIKMNSKMGKMDLLVEPHLYDKSAQ